MKKQTTLFALLFSLLYVFAQQPYYNNVDLTLSGTALRDALATKIIATHTNYLSYDEAREALKIIDLEPGQTQNVFLLYGFSNNMCPNATSDDNDHRLRSKNDFGGGTTCEWNREHTFPKSLGDPNLGTSGPGSDVHHLRSCDVQRNSQRSSLKFAVGSGNSGIVSGGWYPGDEWKGDVARMMMYMYLRYGSQCYPTLVGVGNSVANDSNMIDLFLQWNVEDPVSQVEINRNNYLENTSNQYGQGNRNPFIDNPYLATRIWGGQDAEDTWGIYLSVHNFELSTGIKILPKPASEYVSISIVNPELEIQKIQLYSIAGKIIFESNNSENKINLSNHSSGLYFIKIETNKGVYTDKILKK